jgi:hypothetical protein
VDQPQLRQVAATLLDDTGGVHRELASRRVAEPETATLVPSHPIGASPQLLDVCPKDPAMTPRGHERKITAITEVDDMLARRAEQLGGLSGRQPLIPFSPDHGSDAVHSHVQEDTH